MVVEIIFWHWWTLAGLLLILELLVSGAFFLWIATAAMITGLMLMLIPGMNWEWQLGIFSIFSIISILLWRKYRVKLEVESDQPLLNRRGARYVGRILVVPDGIVNGQGRVKISDGWWSVTGEDCPPGSRVRVVAVDGIVLQVEPDHPLGVA